MALCLNCGRNIEVISRNCPFCNAPIDENTITNKEAVKGYGKKTSDGIGIIIFISCIIPIIGFLIYYKNKDDAGFMNVLKYSLISTIVYLFLITVLIIKYRF